MGKADEIISKASKKCDGRILAMLVFNPPFPPLDVVKFIPPPMVSKPLKVTFILMLIGIPNLVEEFKTKKKHKILMKGKVGNWILMEVENGLGWRIVCEGMTFEKMIHPVSIKTCGKVIVAIAPFNPLLRCEACE